MSKLTKEECVNALEELKGLEIYDDDCDGNTCYESHSKIEDLCSFDVLGQLIKEHFNPPLKLEEDLKQLILDNPEAEIMIGVTEEDYSEEFNTVYNPLQYASINYLTVYNEELIDKEELLEKIKGELENDDNFIYLSNDEFDNVCIEEAKKYEFIKYILLSM